MFRAGSSITDQLCINTPSADAEGILADQKRKISCIKVEVGPLVVKPSSELSIVDIEVKSEVSLVKKQTILC